LGRRVFARNVRYGDIVRGLPVPANSCRAVYCSHVLEHLALDELRRALSNTRNLLVENGVFRFVVPDLRRYVEDYVRDRSPDAAAVFMSGTRLGCHRRPSFPKAVGLALGYSSHRWMWDYVGIRQELENAGFADVRRAVIGDSTTMEFASVESPQRWKSHLGVECRRER
jgi:SAM-dependent methyltransferase